MGGDGLDLSLKYTKNELLICLIENQSNNFALT